MTTPKLSALMRRLETTKARANKIEQTKPDESDRMVAAAINGMKAELHGVLEEAEAIKAEAEAMIEESKKEVAAVHAAMEKMHHDGLKHIESIMAQAAQTQNAMRAEYDEEMGKHEAEIAALRFQLAGALDRAARAETESAGHKKTIAALEKKSAAKPIAQPVIMPSAPKPVVDYIDAVVTQRDLNGRVAGVRFTPGKS